MPIDNFEGIRPYVVDTEFVCKRRDYLGESTGDESDAIAQVSKCAA
jgi:hypothetical protein